MLQVQEYIVGTLLVTQVVVGLEQKPVVGTKAVEEVVVG